jgi:hypothetical protein
MISTTVNTITAVTANASPPTCRLINVTIDAAIVFTSVLHRMIMPINRSIRSSSRSVTRAAALPSRARWRRR